MQQTWKSLETPWCNFIQHEWFDYGSISLECCTDLHVLANSTQTVWGTGMKSLELLSDLSLVLWAVGSSLCRTMPYVARMCRQLLDDESIIIYSPDMNPIENLRDVMYWCIRHRQDLVWEEIHQATIRRLIRSMPRRCWERIKDRGGQTHYWVPLWVSVMKVTQVSACDFRFVFFFNFFW